MKTHLPIGAFALLAATTAACGDAGSPATPQSEGAAGYRIVTVDGNLPAASEGDALRLAVIETKADGTTAPLPSGATIAWSGPPVVIALPEGASPSQSILPQPGSTATAMWVRNPDHLTDAQLSGVLYVIDRGSGPNPSLVVTATVSGSGSPGSVTATIPVAPFPGGDGARGQSVYAANCAGCHGAQGQGTVSAPGLNDSSDSDGNPDVAADPSWSGPLFAITPLDNMDNAGVSLATTMPRWLVTRASNGQLLTTQDFADIYAFLKTQTVEEN